MPGEMVARHGEAGGEVRQADAMQDEWMKRSIHETLPVMTTRQAFTPDLLVRWSPLFDYDLIALYGRRRRDECRFNK